MGAIILFSARQARKQLLLDPRGGGFFCYGPPSRVHSLLALAVRIVVRGGILSSRGHIIHAK